MTDVELKAVEDHLAITLPGEYRNIVGSYPFPADSFGTEGMLLDSVDSIIELNSDIMNIEGVVSPFFIGSDLGEEWYFIDLSLANSPVFVFQLESGEHRVLDPTLAQFIDRIRKIDLEIEADEKAMEERRRNKKWWEFWI